MDKVLLIPYMTADGIPTFRDSELQEMWWKAFDEGWGAKVFADGQLISAGDFLKYVKSDQCLFWGVFYEGELAGFYWMNRLEQTHAYAHFAFFKKWWGTHVPKLIGNEMMKTVLIKHKMVKLLLGMIPSDNIYAINYVQELGWKVVAEIPHLLYDSYKGRSVSGTLVRITREDLE